MRARARQTRPCERRTRPCERRAVRRHTYRQVLAFHSDEVRSHVLTQSQKRTEGGAGCGAR
eukprot:725354-Prymnesium_polylepis.1